VGNTRKRTFATWVALLLALLLILPAPAALAETLPQETEAVSQEETSPSEAVSDSQEEFPQPEGEGETQEELSSALEEDPEETVEETGEPSESESSQDPEEGEETSSLEETQEETYKAYPLLVTTGHKAYMSGESGSRFYPERAMTRAEMAQVLYNLLAAKPAVQQGHFSDVAKGQWYYNAVNVLVDVGVLSGYGDGTFQPNKIVTRAEFVAALAKCFQMKTGTETFTDIKGHWAESVISSAATMGWISGYTDGTFHPEETLKRAQVTAILNNALGRTGDGFAADKTLQEFEDVSTSYWAFEHIAEAADPVEETIKTGDTVRVLAVGGLRMRKGPGTSYDPIEVLSVGTLLSVTSVSNGWVGVKTKTGASGYVSQEYVAFTNQTFTAPEPDPDPDPGTGGFQVGQTVKVTAEPSLRLRSGPGTNYDAITTLATGTLVTVTSVESNGWLGVKTQGGMTGYVSGDYVVVNTGGQGTATGASLSSSKLTIAQYRSVRLDGSVTSNISAMHWESSNTGVVSTGYTVSYGGNSQGAMLYGVKPGTATITFTDGSGTKATCQVTVTAAEPVRFAYAEGNIVPVNTNFDLVGITDSSRAEMKFVIVKGPAEGSYVATEYETASRTSTHGLPTNTVKVFHRTVQFSAVGDYTIRAYSNTVKAGTWSTGYYEFTLRVTGSNVNSTTATYDSRIPSGDGISVLANFEGLIAEIRDDTIATGNPTVGYGYVVQKNSSFYNNLTEEEAYAQLVNMVNNGGYGNAVENFRTKNNIKMSQAQFDALTSFVYNHGSGVLSTQYGYCLALLNATDPRGISESSPRTGTVNVTDVDLGKAPIYSSTSTSSSLVTSLSLGSTVTVKGYKDFRSTTQQEVWYQVTTSSGQVGWMPAGYVRLSGSAPCDLGWADSTVLANNFLQWNTGGIEGLVYRRLAECKIFFFGNYFEAYHSSGYWNKNTYGFHFPKNISGLDSNR
jgi:GH24 family phage-related lysozyme (muramidase)/uncharacterized protein YraI